jgi:hypothetical protein
MKINNNKIKGMLFACISAGVLTGSLMSTAHAGLLTQHVSIGSFERSCPGLSDPDFIINNLAGIEAVTGPIGDWGAQTVDTACRFNSAFQAEFWNNDGSPKFDGLPSIPAFTPDQVGNLFVDPATAETFIDHVSGTGKLEGRITLDEGNLGLPEIKINATSSENERNSFNGYAANEFLWTGDDATLEFELNFDFFHSSEVWELNGYESTLSSDLILNAYVSENLIINPNSLFPADSGDIIDIDTFSIFEDGVGPTSAENPFFGNLSVSFDVTAGQTFFVVGQYQGFAKNGGFINAFNTITSSLNIQGLSFEESALIFENSLTLAPVEVNAPNSLLFMLLGGGLFAAFKKRANK